LILWGCLFFWRKNKILSVCWARCSFTVAQFTIFTLIFQKYISIWWNLEGYQSLKQIQFLRWMWLCWKIILYSNFDVSGTNCFRATAILPY
jgi:hypothetical protein